MIDITKPLNSVTYVINPVCYYCNQPLPCNCEERRRREQMAVLPTVEKSKSLQTLYPDADPRMVALVDELLTLHSKKMADYGPIDSPDGNLRASEDMGISAHVGVLLRMNDKMRRMKHFVKQGNLVNESFEDSLMDLANYSLLALILYRHPSPSPKIDPDAVKKLAAAARASIM